MRNFLWRMIGSKFRHKLNHPPLLDESLELIQSAISKAIKMVLRRKKSEHNVIYIYFRSNGMVSGVNLPGQEVALNPTGKQVSPEEASDAVITAFVNFLSSYQDILLSDLEVRGLRGVNKTENQSETCGLLKLEDVRLKLRPVSDSAA